MIGSNRDELAFFTQISPIDKLIPPHLGQLELDLILTALVGIRHVFKVKDLYRPTNYEYPSNLGNFSLAWWTLVRTLTDSVPGLGACGVRNISQTLSKAGSGAVFSYLFAHPGQIV